MTQRNATERWERKIRNCDVTPQAKWPNAKLLLKRDESNAPHALYGPSGFIFSPSYKTNANTCFGSWFIYSLWSLRRKLKIGGWRINFKL
jgi:hypothetical protein